MLCAPLTYTRRHFVPNRRPPFYPELVLSDTGFALRPYYTHWLFKPIHLLLCPLVLESVHVWRIVQLSPTVHKGLCYFVFPSFTYLTAAVFSIVVFTFLFFIFHRRRKLGCLQSTPDSRPQWPCDQNACATLIILIVTRLFSKWLRGIC